MDTTGTSDEGRYELELVELRVGGELDAVWAARFGGLTMSRYRQGQTLLAGPVVDQAALLGLLRSINDLGLPLIAVICIRPGQANGLNPMQSIE